MKWLTVVFLFIVTCGQARAACLEGATAATLRAQIDEAQHQYFLANYEEARRGLDKGLEALACMAEVAPAGDVFRLHAVLGALFLAEERPALARAAIERAVSIAPTLEWDAALGERGQTLFQTIKLEQERLPLCRLEISPGNSDVELALDGEELRTRNETKKLRPGEHFVQLHRPGSQWVAHWVRVPAEDLYRLTTIGGVPFVIPTPAEAPPAKSSAGADDLGLDGIEGPSSRRYLPWLVAGFGGVTLLSSGVYGYSYYQLASGACDSAAGCDAARVRAATARGVAVTGLVGAAATAALTWLLPTKQPLAWGTGSSRPAVGFEVQPDSIMLTMGGAW